MMELQQGRRYKIILRYPALRPGLIKSTMFTDTSISEINETMHDAWEAFHVYRKLPLKARANFLRAIAIELENCGDTLIQVAMKETNLP